MSEKFIAAGVAVLIGIVGVAVLALLVSRSANTSGVIGAGAGGFACMLRAALGQGNTCGGSASIGVADSTITYPGIGSGRFF